MSAVVQAAPRRGRLSTWFGATPIAQTTSPVSLANENDSRQLVERRLFEDIGEFLFAHRLAPTPVHFEVVHAYLTGSNPIIAGAIGRMLADQAALEADSLSALVSDVQRGQGGADTLVVLAGELESRLADCLSATNRTRSSARDYGDALDRAQTRLDADPAGTLEHIAGLTREVVSTTRLVESELKETRREVDRLRGDLDQARDAAERDHLTGLPNRRGFERRVEQVLAATTADGVASGGAVLALCDIDDFKRINDVHGHQAGDRVLKFVGAFLASQLGGDSYVARHGGEEFAVLIEGRSPSEAMLLLDEVRRALAARSLINQDNGQPIGHVTFSAGLSPLDDDVAGALAAADAALYRAKRGGKNSVTAA